MTDITAFLAARLDEDEALAREAADRLSGQWFVGRKWNVYAVDDVEPQRFDESDDLVTYGDMKERSEHIARHDPARVLAEVKAKRRVLERHYAVVDSCGTECCDGCGWDREEGYHVEGIENCPELRDLAAPFDQHPDYNPAWAVVDG